MPFRFNQLLADVGIAPADVRLLRHQSILHDGRTPGDLLRSDREQFDAYQATQLHAQRAYFAARCWATFVGLRDGRTMFAGLYRVGAPSLVEHDAHCGFLGRVVPGGTDDRYPIALMPELADYIGRLFVEWGGGASGKRAWKQRADLQDKAVIELHLEGVSTPFPGLMQLAAPLSGIAEAPPAWLDHLSGARGVYLLTCPITGEAYVGSARGAEGFWGRWRQYIADGHGGNVALRDRELTDFIVSILQVAGSNDSDDDILAAEMLWKRKLNTKGVGLNRN
jgi:hypothetical protein